MEGVYSRLTGYRVGGIWGFVYASSYQGFLGVLLYASWFVPSIAFVDRQE